MRFGGNDGACPVVIASPTRRLSRRTALALVLLGLIATVSEARGLWNATQNSFDFQWVVGRLMLSHNDPYAMYAAYLGGHAPSPMMGFGAMPVYPPSAVVFLWPFAALPWGPAHLLWAVSNLIMCVGSVILLSRLYLGGRFGYPAIVLLFLLMASTPLREGLGNGQQALFSLFFFLLSMNADRQGSRHLATLFLAMSWLKYNITAPLSIFFLRRDRLYAPIGASLIHVALTLFVATWTGSNPLLLGYNLYLAQKSIDFPGYLNLADLFQHWQVLGVPLSALLILLILGFVVWVMVKQAPKDEILTLSLLSFTALVIVYHREYDYILLVFPLCYILQSMSGIQERKYYWTLVASYIFAIVPIWYLRRAGTASEVIWPGPLTSSVSGFCWAWAAVALYCAFAMTAIACVRSAKLGEEGLSGGESSVLSGPGARPEAANSS